MRRALAGALRSRFSTWRRHVDRCIASGWQLTLGCTDGQGHAICPACTRPIRLRPHRPMDDTAWVVEEH